MSETPRPAHELFEHALALPPASRPAFLQQSCAGDAVLRRTVEELLHAHEAAGSFLQAPAAPPSDGATALSEERAGQSIGRYRLLERIGEGGFGVVWMAEQEEPVRRRVALKVIKLGMDTRAVIARFEAERQALALMDHPNIARVFDGGATASGRPYFVMELVRGIRITDYCDQNRLSPTARLRLAIEVCHAVQHAHQKGVIHRDLKPSNILVALQDGAPVPKVIDFGVAKATSGARLTDKTLVTEYRTLIGTPAYSSPEQVELSGLDVDARSDIYSLGVLIYELLTGRTPFEPMELLEAGIDEMRRQIREVEPPRPSTRLRALKDADLDAVARLRAISPPRLSSLLRGDLDWIVMRCLEKDRRRRYESANSLAEDLGRYLRHEPVSAAAPSFLYTIGKLACRHRTAFAAGTAVLFVLLAAAVASTVLAVRATRAEHAQAASRRAAEVEAARSRQVAGFLGDMLKDVDSLVALGRDTRLLHEILDLTAARIPRDLAGQPEVEADLRRTLGTVYFNLGEFDDASSMFQTELALRRIRSAGENTDIARTLSSLGAALGREGKLPEAEARIREALEIERRLLGEEHAEAAGVLGNLALVLARQNRTREAEETVRAALAMQRRLLGAEHPDIAISLNCLGAVLEQAGRLDDAIASFREALAMNRRLLGGDHPAVVSSLRHLAVVLLLRGRIAEAEVTYRESVAIRRRNDAPPAAPTSVAEAQGTLGEAAAVLQAAYETAQRQYGRESWEAAYIITAWVYFLLNERHFAEAEIRARECIALRERMMPDDWGVYNARSMLGAALAGQGRFIDAEPLLLSGYEGVRAREALLPPHHKTRLAEAIDRLIKLYTDWGKQDEADRWRRTRAEAGALPPPQYPAP